MKNYALLRFISLTLTCFICFSCSRNDNGDVPSDTDQTDDSSNDNTDDTDDSSTTADSTLFLSVASASPNAIAFEYDDHGKVTLRYWLDDDGTNTRTEFTLNDEGHILKDRSVVLQFLQFITDLTYNVDGKLSEGSIRDSDEFTTEYLFEFETESGNYTRTGTYYGDGETTYLGTIYGAPEFDSEDRLTYIFFTDLDSSETSDFTFEYTAGNLTKIIDGGGDLWEFTYDDKKSFHTFYSGSTVAADDFYGPNFDSDFVGLTHLPNTLIQRVRKIPYLHEHLNTNNPLTYKLNGDVFRTFSYDYNEFDYPIKLVTAGEEINFQYIEL